MNTTSCNHRLKDYVDMKDVLPVVNQTIRTSIHERTSCFEVDFSSVSQIGTLAVQRLTRLHRELRQLGSDLRLLNCSEEIRERYDYRLFNAMVA